MGPCGRIWSLWPYMWGGTRVRGGVGHYVNRHESGHAHPATRFMVHAQGIAGWTLYSNASTVVTTPREDAIPYHAVRSLE